MRASESYVPYTKRAYALIRKMILEGQLKPGERLVERRLSEKLRISRTPIRASLQRLSSQGLVYLSPKGGARVSELTTKDINEIYEIRAVLESLAASKAASKIKEQQLQNLKNLFQKAKSEFNSQNYVKMAYINSKFHKILYTSCGNKRLSRLIDTLCTTDTINREVILKNPTFRRESIERISEILDALTKRDEKCIRNLVLNYIERGKNILLETKDY